MEPLVAAGRAVDPGPSDEAAYATRSRNSSLRFSQAAA
jgi:hypothetical protein